MPRLTHGSVSAAAAVIVAVLGWLTVRALSVETATSLFRTVGYWAILAQVVVWVAACARTRAVRPAGGWFGMARRDWAMAFGVAGAMSLAVHAVEAHGWKILWDEASVAGTAFDMYQQREAACVDKVQVVGESVTIANAPIDKRPLLVPFLTSVLHAVTGYRANNTVVLNVVLTPIFFLLLFVAGWLRGRCAGGIAAVALAAGLPLLTDNLAGGGLEVLNLTLLLGLVLVADMYIRRPGPETATLLFVTGCLAAHTRYESIVFLAPIVACIVLVGLRDRRVDGTWLMVVSALVVVILPMQWRVFEADPSRWQLASRPGADAVFSLRYFAGNVGHALGFFVGRPVGQGNSLLLSIVAGVALAWWLMRARTWLSWPRLREATASTPRLFEAALLGHGLLMLVYFYGQFDDPLVSRLALPMLLGLLLITVWWIGTWDRVPWAATVGCITAVFYLGIIGLPAASRHNAGDMNYLARTCRWLQPRAASMFGTDVMVVDPYARRLWVMNRVPAITANELAARPEAFAFHHRAGTYRDVYILQEVWLNAETGTWEPVAVHDFTGLFECEEVDRLVLSPVEAMRLCRVREVHLDALPAWAGAHQERVRTFDAAAFERRLRDPAFMETWVRSLP